MLRRLLARRIDALERNIRGSLEYMREILRVSPAALRTLLKVMPLAHYRRALPPEPYHLARIVASRDADCGPCVQIEVNVARQAGVAGTLIRALLENRLEDLPGELADVVRLAEAVVTANGQDGPLRELVRARYGDAGLVELAMGMAVCRVFPVVKRTLGHAVGCSLVTIRTD